MNVNLFRTLHCFAFLLIAISPNNRVTGQTIRDTLFEEVRSKLEPLIANLGNTGLEKGDKYNLYIVDAILNLRDDEMELIGKDHLYDLKIKHLERDWGLSLRAQVNQNFDTRLFNQDELDAQETPLRYRAGIDWEIMKNGLLSHQNRIQQLKNEKEAEWLKYDNRKNKERYFYRFNVLIYYFNKEKIKLLQTRKAYLEEQLKMLYRIYYIRDIMFEEIISMKGELEQVQVQLKNYLDYNSVMESQIGINEFEEDIDVLKLPVLDIDINRLLSDSAHIMSFDKPRLLERENDQLKNAAVNNISLRLQLYQNLGFSDPNTLQRTYASGGVVASVPLDLLYRGGLPQQIASEEARVREQFDKYEDLNSATEIVNFYYEFNYKLKQYVEFLYKYMLYEEKLRVEQVDRVHFTDYYQPFKILKYYDQLQLIKLEIIDLKQQLYLFLLKIYSKTNLKSLKDYMIPVSAGQYFAKLPASRTIFMNEKDFVKYEPHFIENYLLFNDFNYAILDGESKVDIQEMMGNVRGVVKNTEVQFIQTISWNSSYTDFNAYADLIFESVNEKGYSGFMLKILPEDFLGKGKIGISEIIGKLGNLFVEVENNTPEMVIFLNVPVGFPLQEAAKLSAWADKVILRMDNEQQLDQLKSLPQQLLPFEYLPICISLDVNRFKDRLKLEAYINQIVADKRINDIVFNNFQAFVNMESRMFDD